MELFVNIEGKKGKSTGYEVSLITTDYELAQVFDELFREVYGVTPYQHLKYHKTSEGEREHYRVGIYRREIAYDLWDLDIKGKPYEFHPPSSNLDEEGKRAYLRGFFSGDGNISIGRGGRHQIRIYSSNKEGLEELRELFVDLGFHPGKIYLDDEEYYYFSIPEEDHLKFIREIGSEKLKHISRLNLIRSIDEEKMVRREEKS